MQLNWRKIGVGAALAGAAAILLYKIAGRWRREATIDATRIGERRITSLFLYPVKSLAGMQVTEWPIYERGFMFDRRWMIVRESDHLFLTQRQVPKMSHISTNVTLEGVLTLSSQDSSVTVRATPADQEASAKRVQVEIWKKKFEAMDCGDEVANWLSKVMGVSVRLVEFIHDQLRTPEPAIVDYVVKKEMDDSRKVLTAFPDDFPFMMTSEPSLAELNRKSQLPLEMKRFRPNIVITGDGMPGFEEDTYKVFDIVHAESNSKIRMYNVKPCTRCSIPTIEPKSAVFQDTVGKLLKKERSGAPNTPLAGEVLFGEGLCHELKIGAKIHVGDTLSLVEMQPAPKVAGKEK